MNRPSVHVVAGLLLIVLAGGASAADLAPVPDATGAPAAPGAVVSAVAPRLPARLLSPMVAEVYATIDQQREKIARLRAELAAARGSARSLELQRALSAAKRETELRILSIQADHARREGRVDAAVGLEAAIAAMTTPPVRREPSARPAPSRDSGR